MDHEILNNRGNLQILFLIVIRIDSVLQLLNVSLF